ncbi:MAG TPA: IPT/TIG domain-containing protein [Bryobacteraceae bacterium]|nr:IPT/TIG domain-containing protein [Bryobacteraceae bacterium]
MILVREFIHSGKVSGSYSLVLLVTLAPVLCRAQAPPTYTITTIAGQLGQLGSYSGDGGAATSAYLWGPADIKFDSSGNLYVADSLNERVREISNGNISTVAGNGTAGFAGDGKSATASGTELNSPSGLQVDSKGDLYIADTDNYEVREVTGGTINTVAGDNGSGASFGGDLAAATSAQLWNPCSVAVDPSGNIYIADAYNNVVRVVCETQTPAACTNNAFGSIVWAAGDINTFAGSNAKGAGYTGDGGPATGAEVNNPEGVLLDPAGNLYISDSGNYVVRRVDPSGIITTVVGDGTGIPGYSGDGGPATQAKLSDPKGLALDTYGNLYIADSGNSVIRMVTPGGTITTIAGTGTPGDTGDAGPALSAELNFPSSVAVAGGKIYIADNQNNAIRVLTPGAPQINAGGVITAGDFGASTTVAPGSWIEIYGTNLAVGARTWGSADFSGSNAPTSLDSTSVTVGGQPAYVSYVSAQQVDVQVPLNVTAGTQPLVLTSAFGASAAYNVTVGTNPGIYAPPILNVGGKQYAGAFIANSSTWVLPTGAVSGLTSQPASPGDIITLYGVGFGAVTPAVAAGQLVSTGELTTLTAPVEIQFGTTQATVQYQGLVPGLVGVYQFNVTVPAVPAGNAVPLTFSQGGVMLPQTLYTAVGS